MTSLRTLSVVFLVGGLLTLAAPATHASVIFSEDFPSAASLSAPQLTLSGDTASLLTWNDGIADGIAGPASGGVIESLSRYNTSLTSSDAYMIYQINAPSGQLISDPTAAITIHTISTGFVVTLDSSTDGTTWQNQVSGSGNGSAYGDYGSSTLTLDNTGQSAYQNLSTVYFRIGMPTYLVNTTNPLAVLDDITVNGTLSSVPEPASLALLGLAGVLVLPRRRQHHA